MATYVSIASRRAALVLSVALLTAPLTGCGVNNIPSYEQSAKAAWSEVLNNYKSRNDVIPNLVETVKGFAEQEKSVLIEVVEARAKATSVQVPADILTNPEAMKNFQQVQGQLGGALGRLLAVIEKYPDIKSGQNFLAMQSQLEGIENKIRIARSEYIQSVRQYNTELVTIPGRWWKSFMYSDKVEMATFEIPADEQKVPKVDFGTEKK